MIPSPSKITTQRTEQQKVVTMARQLINDNETNELVLLNKNRKKFVIQPKDYKIRTFILEMTRRGTRGFMDHLAVSSPNEEPAMEELHRLMTLLSCLEDPAKLSHWKES